MELKEHLRALMMLHLEQELDAAADGTQALINEAKASGDYFLVIEELCGVVGGYHDEYGVVAHPLLKAYLGHVLAECPLARDDLVDDLNDMVPGIANALL
ncbi:MAG: hypothetical protein Q7S52_04025 [bacterium]|nr:hypothetical protein [bacterium]